MPALRYYSDRLLEKIIETLIEIGIGSGGITLGIREEGVHSVEQLLLAKYHMNAQVYRHRIRRITDAMMVRGIEMGIFEGIPECVALYDVKDADGYLKYYIEQDDESLFRMILDKSKSIALEFFQRLAERRLLKEVCCLDIDKTTFTDPVTLAGLIKLNDKKVEKIATGVSELFSKNATPIDPRLIIIDKQTVSNPTFKSPGVKIDSNAIMVETKKMGRQNFPDVSSVFRNTGIDPAKDTLYIYLPLDDVGSREDRVKYIAERAGRLKELIEEAVK